MDFILLKDFLATYSLPTLIVAIFVFIITLTLQRVLYLKVPKTAFLYCPFIFGVILYSAYDMLFVIKAFSINIESVYAGLLSGSLSAIINSAINRIKNGRTLGLNATVLLIEGLLEGFVENSLISETAVALDKILISTNHELIPTKVFEKLKENASKGFSEDDLMHLSKLIIHTVSAMKENSNN